MKGEKKPVGLLIGIGRSKPDGEDYDVPEEDAEAETDDDATRELKLAAVRALKSAIKANDDDAMIEALDAYMEC